MTRSLVILTLLLVHGIAQAELEIVITRGQAEPVPVAVVPFSAPPDVNFDLAEIIDANLQRSGLVRPVPRADMLERPNAPDAVNFRNWRAIGAEHVIVGRVTRDGGGGLATRFHMLDVFRGETKLGYELSAVAQESDLRYIAHEISDLIYEQLTGVPGYFNTEMAYVTARGVGDQRRFELMVADADGFNPQVVRTSAEPIMSPAWSPDRQRLAYVAFESGSPGVYIHDLRSGQRRRLVGERGINGAPAWSPDGRTLAVTLSFESNPDIYLIDVQTGARRRLTEHWAIDTEPAFSPDGKSIVFTSDRGGSAQIYQISVNGGDVRRITFEGRQNLNAVFAPDGNNIALVNFDEGRYRIGLLNLQSRELRILSDGPLDESPSFAPNGMVVMYARQGAGGAELATVSVDGHIRQRLRQSGDVREPAWSPFHPASRR